MREEYKEDEKYALEDIPTQNVDVDYDYEDEGLPTDVASDDRIIEQEIEEAEQSEQGLVLPLVAETQSREYCLGEYYVPLNAKMLGKGGQATVYECYSRNDHTVYAAKIYEKGLGENKLGRKKKAVIETIRDKCHSENIGSIFAAGTIDGRQEPQAPYMIVMKKYEPIPKDYLNFQVHGKEEYYQYRFCRAVENLNNALIEAHRVAADKQEIYHCDIKPKNIMWDKDGNDGKGALVLIDFDGGVVNDREEGKSVTNNVETKGYAAPELGREQYPHCNKYTDYYSMGVSLAELIAGVYPSEIDLIRMNPERRIAEKAKAYYDANKETRIRIENDFIFILPADLPPYMERFFRGILFYDSNRAKDDYGQKVRWVGNAAADCTDIRDWISFVRRDRVASAASLPYGFGYTEEPAEVTGRVQEASEKKGDPIRIRYNSGELDTFYSMEEAAQGFLKNWSDAIKTMMSKKDFASSFEPFGKDNVILLRETQRKMQASPEQQEEIFEKEVIDVFLPEHLKKNMLRYHGVAYNSKKEFGKELYSILLLRKQKGKVRYGLPSVGKGVVPDKFNQIMGMFAAKRVSEFLEKGNPNWAVEADTLKIIRDTEEMAGRMIRQGKLSAQCVENLYRIAFRMQGRVKHQIGGKYYADYHTFAAELAELTKTNNGMKKAMEIRRECFDSEQKLRVDIYAWILEADGVVKKPPVSARETF